SATNASAIKRTSRPTHPVRMADSIPLYGRKLHSATEVSTAPGNALERMVREVTEGQAGKASRPSHRGHREHREKIGEEGQRAVPLPPFLLPQCSLCPLWLGLSALSLGHGLLGA